MRHDTASRLPTEIHYRAELMVTLNQQLQRTAHIISYFWLPLQKDGQKYLRLRLVSLSLPCSAECLSSYDLQRPVVCSKRMEVSV